MTQPKKVLLVSSDILPYPGLPTTGAGLRAWSLGKGLEQFGLDVHFSMPARTLQAEWRSRVPKEAAALVWSIGSFQPILDRVQPDVMVVCNWPVLAMIPDELTLPVVLDQHGPHLLERHFQKYGDIHQNIHDKLSGFRKADFFTCAGDIQKAYFYPWLLQAGFDVAADRYAAIPISLDPTLPQHTSSDQEEPTFVYGGVFLPWQDPTLSLSVLVEEMERAGRGKLLFFGGKHPIYPVDTGIFESLRTKLQRSKHVDIQPMRPRDEIIEIYSRSHVAIDLMVRNPERELAFTTRTVEYLWCGLPVIYNNYAELSPMIHNYGAGWTLDPTDETSIRQVIRSILENPAQIRERSDNARQLVQERLTWNRTIEPLARFVQEPSLRPNRLAQLTSPGTQTVAPAGKSPGQLVDEALYHYRNGGPAGLVRETLGYVRRKFKHRE